MRVRHPLLGLTSTWEDIPGESLGAWRAIVASLSLFLFFPTSLCPGSLGESNFTQQSSLLHQVSDHLNQKRVSHLPTHSLAFVFFSFPCCSLSVGILPFSPVFPPTHLKSSRFCLGEGEPLCFEIFKVHPQILQLFASNLSLSGACICVGGMVVWTIMLLMLLFVATRLRPHAGTIPRWLSYVCAMCWRYSVE